MYLLRLEACGDNACAFHLFRWNLRRNPSRFRLNQNLLQVFVLTRLLYANRMPPRIGSGAGFRSKTRRSIATTSRHRVMRLRHVLGFGFRESQHFDPGADIGRDRAEQSDHDKPANGRSGSARISCNAQKAITRIPATGRANDRPVREFDHLEEPIERRKQQGGKQAVQIGRAQTPEKSRCACVRTGLPAATALQTQHHGCQCHGPNARKNRQPLCMPHRLSQPHQLVEFGRSDRALRSTGRLRQR